MKTKVQHFFLFFICNCFCLIAFTQNCTVNAGVDRTVCPGKTQIIEGNIGGNFVDKTTVWTQISGPNTATITNATSVNPTVSNLITGVYVFQIQATCQVGGNAIDQCTFTVTAGATPVSPSQIVLGCYTPGTPINLIGTAPAGHSLTWSFIGSTAPVSVTFNGFSQSSYTGNNPTIAFSAPSSNYCYVGSFGSSATINVTSTNTTTLCSETRSFTIYLTFNPGAITASASTPRLCGPTTPISLNGSCQGAGTGVWTVVSAPLGAPAVTFTPNANSATVKPGNLIAGSYTFRWTVTGAACSTGFADANLVVDASGSNVTQAEVIGKKFCPGTFPNSYNLVGNIHHVSETCLWTKLSGGAASIVNPTNRQTQVNGLTEAGSPYVFVYTIYSNNGLCSSSDTLLLGVNNSLYWEPNSSTNCYYSGGSYRSSSRLGTIPFRYADSIPVAVLYESGPANNIQVSYTASMYNSSGTSTGIVYASNTQNIVVGGMASYTYSSYTLWPTYNQYSAYIEMIFTTYNNIPSCTDLVPGTYKFRAIYKDQCGNTTSKPFFIEINQVGVFNAGSDQMLPCGFTNTTLAGNAQRCTVTPFWTTIKKPAAAPDPINLGNRFNTNAPLTSLQNGSYVFEWHSNSVASLCKINSDTVRVTVATIPPTVPGISVGAATCSDAAVNVMGQLNDDAASGTWTVSSVPAGGLYTISPSVNNPTITFTPKTPNTIYTLTWTVVNGCGNAFATTTITSGATTAIIPDITNVDVCSAFGAFGTLTASPAGGVWTSSNPYYTLNSPNSTNTTVNPNTFQYWYNGPVTFYYTVSSACGTLKDSVSFSSSSSPSVTSGSFCDVVSYPATRNISLTNLEPYGFYEIYTISGPGTASISPMNFVPTSSNYNLAITVSQSGQYAIGLRRKAGTCNNDNTFNVQFSTVASTAQAGPDINLCGSTNSTTLNGLPSPMVNGNGLWTVQTVYSGAVPSILNSNSPTSGITFNSGAGDVLLKWKVMGDNAACGTGTEDFMRITYIPQAEAGFDDYACFSSSTPPGSVAFGLNANNPGSGIGTWSIISQPGGSSATFINDAQHNTTIVGLTAGIYNLRWTITNAGNTCTSSDNVIIVVMYGCSLLPLNLTKFDATPINDDINVTWVVNNFEQGSKYILERAITADGPYTAIANYNNNLTTSYLDYRANKLETKYVYYRLKMIASNNQLSYGKVVAVRLKSKAAVEVFPTIVNKGEPIKLAIWGDNKTVYNLNIVSANGQNIKKMANMSNGNLKIATDDLATGFYVIQITDGENSYPFKVIIK